MRNCIYRVAMGFCLLLKDCRCIKKELSYDSIELNPFKQITDIHESNKKF